MNNGKIIFLLISGSLFLAAIGVLIWAVVTNSKAPSETTQKPEPPLPPDNTNKRSWSELLNKYESFAREIISKERPDLNVFSMPDDSMYIKDFRLDRVRIFYNKDTLLVTKIPVVG